MREEYVVYWKGRDDVKDFLAGLAEEHGGESRFKISELVKDAHGGWKPGVKFRSKRCTK